MATPLHSESRRSYSWWWSSHISPKNSKWLQGNLTEMDAKVKDMIKLIEEDADSFARRAEMYYKRRPELMKLVEEFYRAYRALAERYNHATVELRLAHRTMAEAFPDEVPYSLSDESLSNTSLGTDPEPHTAEINHPIRAFLDLKGLASEPADKGLTQVCESEDAVRLSFQHGLFQLSSENKNLKMKVVSESERASRAEIEVQTLKSILSQIQDEKDSIRVEYEKNLENLSYLKRKLNRAQEDANGLDERAGKAEIEIKILKETLVKLEAERDAILLKYNENLKMITSLEVMLGDSELESQDLKQKLLRLEAEKEAGLLQYHQCQETISTLESKISLAELDAKKLTEQTNEAERRTQELVEAVNKSNEEKEAVAFLYKKCLETLGKMEAELSRAQDEAKRLNSEIVIGAEKLKMAEEQSCLLEKSNQFLQCEAENLAQKIYVKDKELMQTNEELKNLQSSARDGHMRFNQVDASLETLQNLYYGSQEEQRALALEIRSSLQILKDLEALKLGLEEEMQQVKEENRSLNEINLASTLSEKNLKEELGSLRELTDKLEEDFAVQAVENNALQQEINYLREEISSLSVSYGLLMMQVEELRDENLELRGAREQDQERETLLEKLKRMDDISEKNSALEMSLCELNGALGESREMVKQLQESCRSLVGEKSSLLGDKAALLSQLQMVTENMQKLLERNASLETSLCAGRAEVEGLREKSQRVDEICQLLINEKSDILMERSSLALQLENVEKGLGNLERRFENLEEKCSRQEKEKDMTLSQVEELQGYLGLDKQERITYIQSNEARLAALEHQVKFLQEEIQLRKKEFEEEVEKAVISQLEIFVLQKNVEDLEEKNLSLLSECQKQVEASKLSSKLISELESENFEQQVELEMLSDEVGRLRREIYQVFRALQIDPEIWYRDGAGKAKVEKVLMLHIMDKIENMKSSLMKNKDENLMLLIENSLVSTVLGQVRIDGEKLEIRKECVEKELEKIKGQCFLVEKEKTKLLKENGLLKLHVTEACKREKELLSNLQNLGEKLDKLQLENSKMDEENRVLHEKIVLSQDENCALMEENGEILEQAITVGNLSVVYESFAEEKVCEMKTLCQDLRGFYEINSRLKDEVRNLKEQLGVKGEENLHLMRSLEKLCGELHEVKDLNDQLNHQIMVGNDLLQEKARELSEVENKLEESHCSTFELHRTVQELTRDHEELKRERGDTKEEIKSLLQANRQLEIEMSRLREEIEERRAREESMSSELRERSKENELWEAEASSFYLDLQISGVREVLLQNKAHELIEICKTLKNAGGTKIEEVERMKERVGFLEREIGGLKSQLFAYAAVISSLRDDVPSFKQNALLQRQLCVKGKLEKKGEEERTNRICKNHQELGEDHNAKLHAGISDLQIMHNRFEAVEKAVMKEMGRLKIERAGDLRNQLTSIGGTRESKTMSQLLEEKVAMGEEIESEVYSSRTGLLNQVSDSSFSESSKRNFRDEGPDPDSPLSTANEITEQKKSESFISESQFEKELGTENLEISGKEVYRRKFLERLMSDAQKLSSIQTNVEDIRRKATMSRMSKKMGKNADLEAVERQLQEVEEAVEQLMVSNDNLMKDIDGNNDHSEDGSGTPVEVENVSGTVREKKVQEQAKQEIEKIEWLQLEVQNIQYMMKMKDDKKAKAKNRFKRIGTRLLLRDLICSREGTGKRKLNKGCFFCCSRSSIKGD